MNELLLESARVLANAIAGQAVCLAIKRAVHDGTSALITHDGRRLVPTSGVLTIAVEANNARYAAPPSTWAPAEVLYDCTAYIFQNPEQYDAMQIMNAVRGTLSGSQVSVTTNAAELNGYSVCLQAGIPIDQITPNLVALKLSITVRHCCK